MFLFNIPKVDLIYDIETYPNMFCVGFQEGDNRWYFEISEWKNDLEMLCLFMDRCKHTRWVGFNNVMFDYPVMHFIYMHRRAGITVKDIYDKAMAVINTPFHRRYDNVIWDDNRLVPQVDLMLIHHFDNASRTTSLKVLEFNMRMDNIEELPYPVGELLTEIESINLAAYMWHDIDATELFYQETLPMIEFRGELSKKFGKNFTNSNDTKIGKDYFIMKLEENQKGSCFTWVNNKKTKRQTIRETIKLGDVILPYIEFDHPEFNRIHEWYKQAVIKKIKGSVKLECKIADTTYSFGTGGLHASMPPMTTRSDDEYMILDIDVTSYYPTIAIANRLHPEHHSEVFCDIYESLFNMRKQYEKGTAENAMFKLALNGVYGDSAQEHSPFLDKKYTMAITINGQLSLCMLCETLVAGDIEILQANTDGITIRFLRHQEGWVETVCEWWEQLTKLNLEYVEYDSMYIRDCNNYIAVGVDGKLKRKGAYEYNIEWHKDHSALVVPKAAEAALVQGKDIREFITTHQDNYDFFLRAKVDKASTLEHGGKYVGRIIRYFVSVEGCKLEKVMPPKGIEGEFKRANKLTDEHFDEVMEEIGLGVWDKRVHTKNKSVYAERRIGINTGWKVVLCNNVDGCERDNFNFEWYIKQAEKLVEKLR